MKIKDCEYRGFKYSIMFADMGDWRDKLNNFYTTCNSNFEGGFDKTLEVVEQRIKKQIDDFFSKIPTTREEWEEEIDKCLVWTGYEDAEIDHDRLFHLMELYCRAKGE